MVRPEVFVVLLLASLVSSLAADPKEPRRDFHGWEKPTLYAGLALTGASIVGGGIWFTAASRTCSDEGGSCPQAVAAFVGSIGAGVTGLALTSVGGIGVLVAPRRDGVTVGVTARF